MTGHECFCHVLAAFELGACFCRTYDEHIFALEVVGDACYKRIFVTHHDHVDAKVGHSLLDCGKIEGTECDVFAIGSCATVAGCDV